MEQNNSQANDDNSVEEKSELLSRQNQQSWNGCSPAGVGGEGGTSRATTGTTGTKLSKLWW